VPDREFEPEIQGLRDLLEAREVVELGGAEQRGSGDDGKHPLNQRTGVVSACASRWSTALRIVPGSPP